MYKRQIVTFREVLSAIRRFGFQANQDVVIFGAGPVGLCFTRFCKLLGMRTVITIDISDDKTEQARNMGADIVINSSKEDVEAMVLKYLPEGADYVVDAVGINQLLNQGMRLIKYKMCIRDSTNAHNEWLTILVDIGVLGLVSYAGMLISVIRNFLHAGKKSMLVGACGFCVLAYTVNNMFSFQQEMCIRDRASTYRFPMPEIPLPIHPIIYQ